jgi:hypothetical protein
MYHKVYLLSLNPLARRTQSGQRFDSTIVAYGPSNHQQYASITLSQEGQILPHSLIPGFVPSQPIYGFEHMIKSFANQTLWISLDYNWDSSWILDGMLAQSLVIIVSLKLLGLISCENLWLLIARYSALQERGPNDQVIRSLA